jgi:hypothetical protein
MIRYAVPALAAAAALAAGFALVPGAWENAYMNMRDRNYGAAQTALERKFQDGDRSRPTVFPLSELYVRAGQIDKAIEVLSAYAALHPGERDVTERVAALLIEAQRAPQALEELEKLAADGGQARLRELDRRFDAAGDTEGRVRALTALAAHGHATPQDFAALVAILAAKGEKAEALKVAYNALLRWGPAMPSPLAQTMTALAADLSRQDLIAGPLAHWAAAQAQAPAMTAFAAALIDKGQAKTAIAILRTNQAFAKGEPAAVALVAELEAAYGDARAAFLALEGLLSRGALPQAKDVLYTDLGLRVGERERALDFAGKRGLAAYPDALALHLIGLAAETGRQDWLTAQDRAKDYREARPAVAAKLAQSLGQTEKARALAEQAAASAATAQARLFVAQIFLDLGEKDRARTILAQACDPPDAIGPAEAAIGLPVAIGLREGALSLRLADTLRAHDKGQATSLAYVRALALNGRGEEALALFKTLNASGDQADTAFFDALAAAGKIQELQAELFARFAAAEGNDAKRTALIYRINDLKLAAVSAAAQSIVPGLIADLERAAIAGTAREARIQALAAIAPAKALPFLKEAGERDPSKAGYAYLKALKEARRTSELRAFLLFGAANASNAKVQDDYLHELIKQGGAESALPLLAQRARTREIAWFHAYDDALKRAAGREGRAAALAQLAAAPGLSQDLRRQIAFRLLEAGAKPSAEALFLALAENAAPSAQDVKDLLYVWGPRPSQTGLQWLERRAAAAKGAERAAWCAHLLNAGGARAVIRIGEAEGEADASMLPLLAAAFVDLRDKAGLQALARDSAARAVPVKALTTLAEASAALGLEADAARLFALAAAKDPDFHAAAGRAAFFAGRREEALTHLSIAVRTAPGPETSFYLAETLTALGRPAEARDHYAGAVARVSDGAKPEVLRLRMIARLRLRDYAAARADRDRLDPAGTGQARDDYAAALLDQGDIDRAGDALGLKTR